MASTLQGETLQLVKSGLWHAALRCGRRHLSRAQYGGRLADLHRHSRQETHFCLPGHLRRQGTYRNGEGKTLLLDVFSGMVLAEDETLAGAGIDATPAVTSQGMLVINRRGDMVFYR